MTAGAPQDARAAAAKQLRKMRAQRLALRLAIGVGLPTLLAGVYFGAVASPQFESVSTFTVQSSDGAASANPLQSILVSVPGGSASRDVSMVEEYLNSRDMLAFLLRRHRYAEHYGHASRDFYSRLAPDASFEEQYEYFLDHTEIEHDTTSGMLTLRVRAFSAAQSHRLGMAMLEASERMVNDLNERARNDRIRLSQREVTRAERRLTVARQALAELQGASGDLNPQATAAAAIEVRTQLEGQLAVARAELNALRATMPPDSPEVQQQRQRVSAITEQIESQSARLSGAGGGDLGDTIATFEPVVIEKEFAERAYESALTSLELARVDADRQHRYLVRVAGPSQPEDAEYPRTWYAVLTVLILSFVLLGIGTLVLASVREHANV